jgi:DNA topoisomerase-2
LELPKGHKVTRIDITVDPKENIIAVRNDGQGIDVEFMEEHQMYPAELIFGTLLTSTNYDDTEKKIVGGKNGYGAKLANIFSTEFKVETVDAIRQRKISLTYRANMSEHDKAKVSKYKSKPYTLVSMKPDLKRFGCDRISDDMVALCLRSALDASAWTDPKTAVYWNGTRLPTKSLDAYADLWMGKKSDVPRVSLQFNPLWNAVVSVSTDDVLQQMSWVNGVATTRGGKHIDAVLDIICDSLSAFIEKKHK